MLTRLIDVMDHELHRWDTMSQAAITARIWKLKKFDKLICSYVIAHERGDRTRMSHIDMQLYRNTGKGSGDYGPAIQSATRIYRQLVSGSSPWRTQSEEDLLPLPEDGTVPVDSVITTERDPLTGRSVATLDLRGAARSPDGWTGTEYEFPPDPEPHDTETCSCGMCKSIRATKHLREIEEICSELDKQIKELKKPETGVCKMRRIRFKRRKNNFVEGWRQPLLGGK